VGFLYGFVAGLVVAAPLGPAALLLIRRTLERGWLSGFAVGVGAATGDLVFGTLALLGVQTAADFIDQHDLLLRLAGGAVLLATAAWTFGHKPPGTAQAPRVPKASSLMRGLGAGFVLTITNPITLGAFLAVYAALGIGDDEHLAQMIEVILGVLTGACAWMASLAWAAGMAHGRLTDRLHQQVATGTALLLAVFGISALGTGVVRLGAAWLGG